MLARVWLNFEVPVAPQQKFGYLLYPEVPQQIRAYKQKQLRPLNNLNLRSPGRHNSNDSFVNSIFMFLWHKLARLVKPQFGLPLAPTPLHKVTGSIEEQVLK